MKPLKAYLTTYTCIEQFLTQLCFTVPPMPDDRRGPHMYVPFMVKLLSFSLVLMQSLFDYASNSDLVLSPDPPFNTAIGKGGLVNIIQHFCRSAGISVEQSDWLMWQLSRCTGLPYRKPLSFTHHTFTDLLSTPLIY